MEEEGYKYTGILDAIKHLKGLLDDKKPQKKRKKGMGTKKAYAPISAAERRQLKELEKTGR